MGLTVGVDTDIVVGIGLKEGSGGVGVGIGVGDGVNVGVGPGDGVGVGVGGSIGPEIYTSIVLPMATAVNGTSVEQPLKEAWMVPLYPGKALDQ